MVETNAANRGFRFTKGPAKYLLILGFIFLLVSIFYLATNTLIKDRGLEKCISGIKMNTGEYKKGELVSGFKRGVSINEIKNILSPYGFDLATESPLQISETTYFIVKVPEGEEFKWVCTLKQDSNIQSAELNSLYRI